jgi:hypothetical protein
MILLQGIMKDRFARCRKRKLFKWLNALKNNRQANNFKLKLLRDLALLLLKYSIDS